MVSRGPLSWLRVSFWGLCYREDEVTLQQSTISVVGQVVFL